MAPYVCPVCAHKFSQKSHLDDHMLKKIPCVPASPPNTVEYDDSYHDLRRNHQCEMINLEIKQKKEILALDKRELVYSNQAVAANDIITQFHQGKVIVCLVAQPGTGKTGTAHQVMMQLATHIDPSIFTFVEEIIVLSGMNDKEWKGQFEKSVCNSLAKNIIHRGILPRAKELLKKSKLVIDDECHAAADQEMVVSRMLEEAELLNIENLKTRGVRKLLISATPEAVLRDLEKWGDLASMVMLKPSENYKGFQHMLDDGRILKSPPIDTISKCEELLTTWTCRFDGKTAKYFPCRISSTANRKNMISAARNLGWAEPLEHDSESRIEDIDEQMKAAPSKHTIIFIKGFWRASKRLIQTHVGGSYEQIPKGKKNTTATSQGLTARFCNTYDYVGDQIDQMYRPLHYCNVDSVKEYLNWIEKGANYKEADYTSAKITAKHGKVKSKPTKVHTSNVKGLGSPIEEADEDKSDSEFEWGHTGPFRTQAADSDASKFLGFKEPASFSANEKGFKECSLTHKRVHSLSEILAHISKKIRGGYDKNIESLTVGEFAKRRCVCYEDLEDPSTERYVTIWVKRVKDSQKLTISHS